MSMVSAELLREVMDHYQVGEQFASLYLEQWMSSGNTPAHLQDILQSPPPLPLWFNFALTTNLRGIELTKRLAPYISSIWTGYLT
jgi:hypothetical protein